MSGSAGGIQSVERAIALLNALGDGERELGVTELSRRMGLHKSTISRLLATLEQGRLVEQDPRTGRFRLGLGLATLAGLVLNQLNVRDVARSYLADLARRSGETATLSVLDGQEAVNVEEVPGPQPLRHIGWVGRRLPLHATAAGRPFLAHMPPAAVDELLARPLTAYAPRTLTDPVSLRGEIERVRRLGFAIVEEEYEADLTAVGAPVRDHRGAVVATITVSGPSFRMPSAKLLNLGALVKRAASQISSALGYTERSLAHGTRMPHPRSEAASVERRRPAAAAHM